MVPCKKVALPLVASSSSSSFAFFPCILIHSLVASILTSVNISLLSLYQLDRTGLILSVTPINLQVNLLGKSSTKNNKSVKMVNHLVHQIQNVSMDGDIKHQGKLQSKVLYFIISSLI
jgi:hypothetical protein